MKDEGDIYILSGSERELDAPAGVGLDVTILGQAPYAEATPKEVWEAPTTSDGLKVCGFTIEPHPVWPGLVITPEPLTEEVRREILLRGWGESP